MSQLPLTKRRCYSNEPEESKYPEVNELREKMYNTFNVNTEKAHSAIFRGLKLVYNALNTWNFNELNDLLTNRSYNRIQAILPNLVVLINKDLYYDKVSEEEFMNFVFLPISRLNIKLTIPATEIESHNNLIQFQDSVAELLQTISNEYKRMNDLQEWLKESKKLIKQGEQRLSARES